MLTKTATWEETAAYFRRVTDKLGKKIDTGIFETVVTLNMAGIATRASCQGHLDWGLPYPWIDLEPEMAFKYQLHQYLRDFYKIHHVNYEITLIFHGYRLQPVSAPFAELHSAEERESKLQAYRAEMAAFTTWLKRMIDDARPG